MKRLNFIATGFAMFFAYMSYGQSLQYEWSSSIGGTGNETCGVIRSSQDGYCYIGGTFQGTVNFNPSGTPFTGTASGNKNGYLTKKNSDGSFVWTVLFKAADLITVEDILIDENNDSYVVGSYMQNMTIDDGTNLTSLPFTNVETGFIAKCNSSGALIWAYSIASDYFSRVSAIEADSDDNIVVAGRFADSTNFDLQGGSTYLISDITTNNTYTDGFFAKYTSSGTLLSAHRLGGQYSDNVTDVAVDSENNIVLTGDYNGSFDCDPSANSAFLPYSNVGGIFLVKYNELGDYVFSGGYTQSSGSDHIARKVIVDESDNIFVCGEIAENIDLDFSAATYTVTGYSGRDVFYAKYNPNGAFQWGNSFGNSSTQTAGGIGLDESNQLYITGSYIGNMSIDDGLGNISPTLVNNGGFDIYVARYNENGELIWTTSYGGNQADMARTIEVYYENVYIGGDYSNIIDLDPLSAAGSHTSNGSSDAFNLKLSGSCSSDLLTVNTSDLSICLGESVTITSSGMDQITYSNGVNDGVPFYPTTSGIYTVTGVNTSGAECMVEASLNIIVNTVNINVTSSATSLTAALSGATYQWLNCNQNYAVIAGQTQQVFSPTQTGSYAVEVEQNGCVDTSSCTTITISTSGLIENGSEFELHVFPNPANDFFTVELENSQIETLSISSILGELVYENNSVLSTSFYFKEGLTPGLYYVRIETTNGTILCEKIVLE